MAGDIIEDVPSPIDFHNPGEALSWTLETIAKKPHRAAFFDAFVNALAAHGSVGSVLELGSGPGHLAEQLLSRTSIRSYTLLDFSAAMHDLARERISSDLDRVRFVQRDFRDADWHVNLGSPTAVVTMQAVHELRHKARAPLLYKQVLDLLDNEGMFLVCDGFTDDSEANRNADLFMTRKEQRNALEASGFGHVESLLEIGGMTLYQARKGG